MRRHHHFAKCRQLEGDRAVGVERKRGAVEHQFVLAADLIDVNERQSRLGDARDADVEPHVDLIAPVRRTVGHDKDFGAGLGQALDDILVIAPVGPGVLADRQAEPHAAKADRPGHRAGGKDALLVEHAVIRQVDLETDGVDAAAGEQRIGIIELAVLHPGRAHEHGGSAVGGVARQGLDRSPAGGLERRLEHQILRRITGDKELGERDDVGAVPRGFRPRLAGAFEIAGDVADDRVKLRHGDGQTVGGTLVHDTNRERMTHERRRTKNIQALAAVLCRPSSAARPPLQPRHRRQLRRRAQALRFEQVGQ